MYTIDAIVAETAVCTYYRVELYSYAHKLYKDWNDCLAFRKLFGVVEMQFLPHEV